MTTLPTTPCAANCGRVIDARSCVFGVRPLLCCSPKCAEVVARRAN